MGINSNLVTLGAAMPAQKADAGQASQANSATDAGSPDGSTAASGAAASGASASTPKTAVPSGQRRPNARAHARSNAAGSTGNTAGADPQLVAPESTADFGSVMASALGRSAAGNNDGAAPVNTTTDTTTDATTPAPPAHQAPGSADPAAWLAQALMPPAAAPAAAGVPGTSSPAVAPPSASAGPALIALPADPGSAAVDAQTAAGYAAQLAAQNALGAGPSPRTAANALRSASNANSTPTPVAPDSDAQTVAAPASAPGNITILADVQKLISGLSGPDSADTDTDPDAGTPTPHTATASASTDSAQAAAALQAASLARPNALGAATLTIHAPVGSTAFADEVGARATSLAQAGITQAQLQLNPADMGPVQVHITLQAGQASVWFGATHADTRAALEQSLPRLRELFAGAGMPLTDSGVFREPPQQQPTQPLVSASAARTPSTETQVAASVTQVTNVRLSLLDTYA